MTIILEKHYGHDNIKKYKPFTVIMHNDISKMRVIMPLKYIIYFFNKFGVSDTWKKCHIHSEH